MDLPPKPPTFSWIRNNNGSSATIPPTDSRIVFHMMIAGNYGYFRDELYYIVAGQLLAFGYVDFPPMIALLAAIMKVLARESSIYSHNHNPFARLLYSVLYPSKKPPR